MMSRSWKRLAACFAASVVVSCAYMEAEAAPTTFCNGAYGTSNQYWKTTHPSASTILGRMPTGGSRRTFGNVVMVEPATNSSGAPLLSSEFSTQWNYIFGTSTSTGYGTKLAGSWPSGATRSWGLNTNSSAIKKNISECVVNGGDSAICLGIPSGSVQPSSMGQHSAWQILDQGSLGSVGTKSCLVYEVLFSSNFNFQGIDGKLPGSTNVNTANPTPPGDQVCSGTSKTTNNGTRFSTRMGWTDGGGDSDTTNAKGKLANQFRNDMLSWTCSGNKFLTEMHATGPSSSDPIQRGVWYRFEHEVISNTNYSTSAGQLSGATSKLRVFRTSDEALMLTLTKTDEFTFNGTDWPLIPKATSSSAKNTGIWLSIQQGGTVADTSTLGYAIALRNFGLYLK
jgi:hypothetical protein